MEALNKEILTIKNKATAKQLATIALTQKKVFIALLKNCQDEDMHLARKSAWVLSALFDDQKTFFKNHVNTLWEILLSELPYAIERSLLRIVYAFPIPEKHESAAFDLCLKRLLNPQTAIANVAFSFEIALKLCQKYPELKQELALVIPLLKKSGSPGVLVKVKRFEK